MFLAHYGVALGLKKVAPKTSLATLVVGTTLLDLLWPLFLMLGWEQVEIVEGITKMTPLDFSYYPFSHSLVAVIGWSLFTGIIYFAITRYRVGAFAICIAVASHWFLDVLVHRPDLPLGFSAEIFFGLGLWNYPIITLILEFGILCAGLYFYIRTTSAVDMVGRYALYGFIGTLSLIYIANILGPVPPSVAIISYVGNAAWLFVLWAFWIDKHRSSTLFKPHI